jgi:hypothetical protein
MAATDPLSSNSYNPTDNANFTAPASKVKGTKAPKVTKVSVGKLKTTVKMPKASSGGLKGFARTMRTGAKAMSVKTPKFSNSKMSSAKPGKYVVG